MTNVIGTSPAAVGPGQETFNQLFQDEYDSSPGVFTAQAYDATAVHLLAQLRADELTGPAVSEQIREVANPSGEVIQPDSLADGLEMAENGDEIQYQGASSTVEFDENGDPVISTFEVFEFNEDGYEVIDEIEI